jgi:hypothetical protein
MKLSHKQWEQMDNKTKKKHSSFFLENFHNLWGVSSLMDALDENSKMQVVLEAYKTVDALVSTQNHNAEYLMISH